MRLVVAAAVLLVGCGTDTPKDCSLPAVVDDYVADATLDDCGALVDDGTGGIDTAAFQAAQACALDHAQQHRAFRVRWTMHAIEGLRDAAYVGVEHDGAWTLSSFLADAAITGGTQPTGRAECTDLRATSPCPYPDSDLCIECVGRTAAYQCMP